MSILGIENRTENWKTVEHFYGLPDDAKLRLVQGLSGTGKPVSGKIEIQLFWKGGRDYVFNRNDVEEQKEDFMKRYNCIFPDLRNRVEEVREKLQEKFSYRFSALQKHNYVCKPEHQGKLFENLRNTEIDIVMETSDYLFIGEAKDQSRFRANPNYVLMHQLIREFVLAKILLAVRGCEKEIIPFIVWSKHDGRNPFEVEFMLEQCWLKERNILTWECVKNLTRACNHK